MSDGATEEPRDEPLDPVAFAEKWFEDHPEVLDKYNRDCNNPNISRKARGRSDDATSEDAQGQGSDF